VKAGKMIWKDTVNANCIRESRSADNSMARLQTSCGVRVPRDLSAPA
jgi:hypothetical protein